MLEGGISNRSIWGHCDPWLTFVQSILSSSSLPDNLDRSRSIASFARRSPSLNEPADIVEFRWGGRGNTKNSRNGRLGTSFRCSIRSHLCRESESTNRHTALMTLEDRC